jgi:hypothetical protein
MAKILNASSHMKMRHQPTVDISVMRFRWNGLAILTSSAQKGHEFRVNSAFSQVSAVYRVFQLLVYLWRLNRLLTSFALLELSETSIVK